MKGRRDLAAVAVLAGAWLLVILGVGLGGDYPLNDDWCYAWSARRFAATGELRILDWAAPSLAGHVVWGAALIRWLGDSFVVLRAGTLVWALVGLCLVYALTRRFGEPPERALVPALALGWSPWFVNLAFTYMTDVPWLAMMVAPMLALAWALRQDRRPRRARLLLAGALTGAAALTRQFAMLALPALALPLLLDARARKPRGVWLELAISLAALGLPAIAIFAPFQHWYLHVHGATLAYRETWERTREVTYEPFTNLLPVLHYVGLWLLPLSASLVVSRRAREVVTRRTGWVLGLLLAGYAIVEPIWRILEASSKWARPAIRAYTMPYLGNIFYLTGLGPPTVFDVYQGIAPLPHRSFLFGAGLTIATTVSGVVGGALVVRAGRRGWAQLRGRAAPEPVERGGLRVLLLGFGALYLAWLVGTSTFVFDRYLLPLLPLVVILAMEGAPRLSLRPIAVVLAISGLLSVVGTREYLAWNGARDRLVRRLDARGVKPEEVDAGFEINGARRFADSFARTGRLLPPDRSWWAEGAHLHLSFWPGPCRKIDEEPYWTPLGARSMYTLECAPEPLPFEPTR